MAEKSLKNPQLVTDSPKVTGYDGLHRFNWRQFWLVSKPAKNRHNPSPVTNCEKTSVSTPSETLQPVSADAQSTLHLAESAETERTARIRALAATVTPAALLQARKTIEPALRRNCTGEEIHELLLLRCWLDQDGGELTSNGESNN
jgi:hypothetical protein